MDSLGAPIGKRTAVPSDGFDQGEHGAGIGLSGGANAPNEFNSQSGAAYKDVDAFNAGLGAEHASGGIPNSTPIADQYMSAPASDFADSGTGFDSGAKLDNSLDNYSGAAGNAGAGFGAGDSGGYGTSYAAAEEGTVSGAYTGGGTSDALTGQSGAQTTGAGVGYAGENVTGVEVGDGYGGGQKDGAGGQYPTQDGAGANNDSGNGGATGKMGKYGTVDEDPSRGEPVANPEDLDTGGRHGLVYVDGKYEHRHTLEGN